MRSSLGQIKTRLILAALSAPLLIPVTRFLGWVSYGAHSKWTDFLLDLACVMFVTGLWFAVLDCLRRKDPPVAVRRKLPPVQLPLLQRAIGFIVGSAIQYGLGGIVDWILRHLIPWPAQEVLFVSALFPFGVGAVIGCSIFYGRRMLED